MSRTPNSMLALAIVAALGEHSAARAAGVRHLHVGCAALPADRYRECQHCGFGAGVVV
jgi:hypothetical protein